MATTRDFTSLGVVAEDAITPVPPTPTPGIPYRNDALTPSENEEGERYNTVPNSADVNQILYIISSFTNMIDSRGIPGWSEDVDYEVPAIVWASDGQFYLASQASGPGNGGAQDPQASPAYWDVLDDLNSILDLFANQTPGSEGTRLVGHTNETLYAAVTNLQTTASIAMARYNGASDFFEGDSFGIDNVTKVSTGVYLFEYPVSFVTGLKINATVINDDGNVSICVTENMAPSNSFAVELLRIPTGAPVDGTVVVDVKPAVFNFV